MTLFVEKSFERAIKANLSNNKKEEVEKPQKKFAIQPKKEKKKIIFMKIGNHKFFNT